MNNGIYVNCPTSALGLPAVKIFLIKNCVLTINTDSKEIYFIKFVMRKLLYFETLIFFIEIISFAICIYTKPQLKFHCQKSVRTDVSIFLLVITACSEEYCINNNFSIYFRNKKYCISCFFIRLTKKRIFAQIIYLFFSSEIL